MKKQQETMKLYNKAGVNPMAGCLPGLCKCQYFMLFQFFPSELSLRQKVFYGQMIYLHSIQFMSYHFIFLRTVVILVCSPMATSIAIFFYIEMTTGDQQMQAPQQEEYRIWLK
jgi:YidC/Oxa1 family membrane protein insertase